jgi:glycerophosphoryl diester phosphodiesterase
MKPGERGVAVVAHRGDARFPENTIPALAAALEAGAAFVELDVQVSADGVPVVIHDDRLDRTAGRPGRVPEMTAADLCAIAVPERLRFGDDRFASARIPALGEVAALIARWPGRGAFVEIKRASLRHHGTAPVVDAVLAAIVPALSQCVVISYDDEAIRLARASGAAAIGWVVEEWDVATRGCAAWLAPDYLFCETSVLPPDARPWPGPWRWIVYDVDDARLALALAARGIDLVETRRPGPLVAALRASGGLAPLAGGAAPHG